MHSNYSRTERRLSGDLLASPTRTLPGPPTRRDFLSVEEEAEIAEAFELFDADGDGCVDFYELRGAFRAVGEELARRELDLLLRGKNALGDHVATREDYLPEARRRLLRRNPGNLHQSTFRLFTGPDSPFALSEGDILRVAAELGVSVSEEEAVSIIDEFDTDHDRMLSEAEFVRALKEGQSSGSEGSDTIVH